DASLGDELMYSMDRWDGYVEAQQRLTEFLGTERVSNPVIVAGDIHTSWINDVKSDVRDPESPAVAAEFVGTSLVSGGDGQDRTGTITDIQRLNPHIHYHDARRGYVTVEASADLLQADYRQVPFVTRPGAPVTTETSYVVEPGLAGTRPA
ncbi:MAG: alkaline phosphatase D family protein, partial [Longimicrobiales bacterium]